MRKNTWKFKIWLSKFNRKVEGKKGTSSGTRTKRQRNKKKIKGSTRTPNIQFIGVPEEKKKKVQIRRFKYKRMSVLIKCMDRRVPWVSITIKENLLMPRHIILKFQNTTDKKNILKTSRKNSNQKGFRFLNSNTVSLKTKEQCFHNSQRKIFSNCL